jgi:hypothetical protein
MTKRAILTVALKILGVYFLWSGIVSLPIILVSLGSLNTIHALSPEIPEFVIVIALVLFQLLMIIFPVLLIRYSDLIAKKLIKSDPAAISLGKDLDSKGLFAVALKIIGVLLLTQGIPSIAKKLLGMTGKPGFSIFSYAGLEIFGEIVRLLIGLCLIFFDKLSYKIVKNKKGFSLKGD